MTSNVRACLSYDPFKWDFIAFELKMISMRKRTVDTIIVNDVSFTRLNCFLRIRSDYSYDTTFSTEYSKLFIAQKVLRSGWLVVLGLTAL